MTFIAGIMVGILLSIVAILSRNPVDKLTRTVEKLTAPKAQIIEMKNPLLEAINHE